MKTHAPDAVPTAFLAVVCISLTHQMLNMVIGIQFSELGQLQIGAGVHLSIFSLGAISARLWLMRKKHGLSLPGQITAGMLLVLLADGAYLFSGSGALLTAARLIQGIGFGMAGSAAPTLLMVQKKRPLLQKASAYSFAVALASALGQGCSLQLLQASKTSGFSFCVRLDMFFACSAIAAGWAQRAKSCKNELATPDTNDGAGGISLHGWLLLAGFCGALCVCNGYMTLLPLYAAEQDITGRVGGFMAASAIAGLAVRPLIPQITKRIGGALAAGSTAIAYAAAVAVLIWRGTGASFLFAGLLQGIFGGILMTMFHFWLLRGESAESSKKINNCYLFAIDVSMILCGGLWAYLGIALGFAPALGVNMLGLVSLGAVFVWLGKEEGKSVTWPRP